MKVKVKFSLSFGMWILAWIMAIVGGFSYDRKFILFAMTASFIGDLYLMWYGMGGRHRKSKCFVGGIISFGIAHIFYSTAFLTRIFIEDYFINVGSLWGIILGIFVASTLIGVFLYKLDRVINFSLRLPVFLYATIIGVTISIIYWHSFIGRVIFPAIGITLFAISDFLIGIREFMKVRTKNIQRWIWILYVTGQTMLIIS